MRRLYESIAASLASERQGLRGTEARRRRDEVINFVYRQSGLLPDFMRAPFGLIALTFLIESGFRKRDLFWNMSQQEQLRALRRWQTSHLGFRRDFYRFFDGLTTAASAASVTGSPTGQEGLAVDEVEAMEAIDPDLHCECLVIGTGPGGAVTAATLAEGGRQVVIIEEGPSLAQNSAKAFSLGEINQKYRNGGLTFAFGNPRVTYAEGRCVGGGSEINAGLYHRTPPEILEKWRREFSVEGLESGVMERCFHESERQLGLSPGEPGFDPISAILVRGAERVGVGRIEMPMFTQVAASNGDSRVVRRTMSQSYLPRAITAGARLYADTQALSIKRVGRKWRVCCRVNSKENVAIYAEKVFIAAGAVQTPALLRRSGFTRNIGDTLQMHPTLKVLAEFTHDINSTEVLVAPAQIKDRHACLSYGCSVSSVPHLALAQFNCRESSECLQESWRRMALYYVSLSGGESRGVIRVVPGFRDSVLRYRLVEEDMRRLAGGLKTLSRLLVEAGAVRVSSSIHAIESTSLAKDIGVMGVHLFSSCPMGENKKICATNSFGQIHDQQGLFIADASLLCSAPGVNPQGSIMAIARRNALHHLGKV